MYGGAEGRVKGGKEDGGEARMGIVAERGDGGGKSLGAWLRLFMRRKECIYGPGGRLRARQYTVAPIYRKCVTGKQQQQPQPSTASQEEGQLEGRRVAAS